MVGVDTNILVYAYDRSSPWHESAKVTIRQILEDSMISVADLSLFEFFAVMTDGRKVAAPLNPKEATEIISNIIEADEFQVCYGNRSIVQNAFRYAADHNIPQYKINDVYIAVTLSENGTDTILTRNSDHFKRFSFIQTINPFLPNVGRIEPREEGPTPTALPPIPYGRQSVNEKDVAAVCRVLRSDFLTQGPAGPAFERAVAEYCGARQAVAVNSGTAALHLACLALGVGAGDRVWTSPITFVASANCAVYCGAEVDFVDIDRKTYNLNVERLKEKLEQSRVGGRLPKVVIPVHLAGQACDLAAIYDLAQEYGFRILEDACHALGGRYQGEPVGNGRYSDITVFSFHPVKTITTGEGGLALTNDPELARRMALLRSHGLTRNPSEMTRAPEGPWYYQQIELGFNYRLTDLQAALGLSQLERLDAFVARRQAIARRYDLLLAGLPVITPWQHPDSYSGFHLYVIRLKLQEIGKTHREVFESLRDAGIGVNLHYIPVYRQPYYKRMGFKAGHCPEAERYYAEALSLPIFPDLTESQQDRVAAALAEALG